VNSFLDVVTLLVPSNNPTDASADEKTVEKFTVHKAFLCEQSPFFNAAFNGNFKEAHTQSMTIEDADSEAVKLVIGWIYTKEIGEKRLGVKGVPNIVLLAKVWTLAQRFLMPALQNEAMKMIYVTACGGPEWTIDMFRAFLTFAYAHEDGDNALARFGLQMTLHFMHLFYFEELIAEMPAKMGKDLALAVKRKLRKSNRKLEAENPSIHDFLLRE
jgi:hypothetical protein